MIVLFLEENIWFFGSFFGGCFEVRCLGREGTVLLGEGFVGFLRFRRRFRCLVEGNIENGFSVLCFEGRGFI